MSGKGSFPFIPKEIHQPKKIMTSGISLGYKLGDKFRRFLLLNPAKNTASPCGWGWFSGWSSSENRSNFGAQKENNFRNNFILSNIAKNIK